MMVGFLLLATVGTAAATFVAAVSSAAAWILVALPALQLPRPLRFPALVACGVIVDAMSTHPFGLASSLLLFVSSLLDIVDRLLHVALPWRSVLVSAVAGILLLFGFSVVRAARDLWDHLLLSRRAGASAVVSFDIAGFFIAGCLLSVLVAVATTRCTRFSRP